MFYKNASFGLLVIRLFAPPHLAISSKRINWPYQTFAATLGSKLQVARRWYFINCVPHGHRVSASIDTEAVKEIRDCRFASVFKVLFTHLAFKFQLLMVVFERQLVLRYPKSTLLSLKYRETITWKRSNYMDEIK